MSELADTHARYHVEQGGDPAVIELGPGAGSLVKFSTEPMDNNCYLICPPASAPALLVDAAGDAPRIRAQIERFCPAGIDLIITTHSHWDHVGALAELVELAQSGHAAGGDGPDLPVAGAAYLAHGEIIRQYAPDGASADLPLEHVPIAEHSPTEQRCPRPALVVEVIELRGHTPGGIGVALRTAHGHTHILSGDSLFPGGVGKTGDAASFSQLLSDVTERIFERFPEAVIHPGHGDSTTVASQAPHLQEWAERGW